jgi:hypothetical protein
MRAGVRVHDRELAAAELAGLVEDFGHHHGLAHVVQQACQSGLAARIVVEAERAGERHHQRTRRHRIAHHRGRDVVDQRQALLRVDGLDQPDVGEHRRHRRLGVQAQRGRLLQRVVEAARRLGLGFRCIGGQRAGRQPAMRIERRGS